MAATLLSQIQVGISSTGPGKNDATPARQFDKYRAALLNLCPAYLWPNNSYRAGCPMPILIGKVHQQQLQNLHEALTIAINDIVCRWWTDRDARFPERMPLEKDEEDLLRWIDSQVAQGNLRKFPECMGSWRPDFLVENYQSPKCGTVMEESFAITEINARFSFNGFMHVAHGQRALDEALQDASEWEMGVVGATDSEKLFEGLLSLFRPDLPLHLLKGQEAGMDIHMFIDEFANRFGSKPKLITPNELRLMPDPGCRIGYRLCCISKDNVNDTALQVTPTLFTHNGEILEEISQVGLELHQRELAALSPEILRHLSLRCFNDMRTILLVHDKRMLGIVRQEVPNMVTRQVLNQAQADALDRGIAHTILPNSLEAQSLLQASRESAALRLNYILKPIRSGKGEGIRFGEDLSPGEWVAELENLQSLRPGRLHASYVLQRRIVPRVYDVVLRPSEAMDQYPLVGTYHVVNGELLGLGIWRANRSRIVAISSGGSWICSAVCRQ